MISELFFLKRWCIKFSDLLIENTSPLVVDFFKGFKSTIQQVDNIESSPLRKKVLNSGTTELFNFYKQLDPEIRQMLNSSMKKEFGISVEEFYNKKMNNIIKKNKLSNDAEYYMIMEILNDTANGLDDSLIDLLNKLIEQYEKTE